MCLDRRTIALMLSGYFSVKALGSLLAALMGWTATIPELGISVGTDLSLVSFFASAALAVLLFRSGKTAAIKGKAKKKRS